MICLSISSGRGCQVIGDDRMKWKKINLDTPLKVGDVMGCGWVKDDASETMGLVYFTLNGTKIQQEFKDAPSNMYPFLHLQKKVSVSVCVLSHPGLIFYPLQF